MKMESLPLALQVSQKKNIICEVVLNFYAV
jgi:hypothetical protein